MLIQIYLVLKRCLAFHCLNILSENNVVVNVVHHAALQSEGEELSTKKKKKRCQGVLPLQDGM